MRQSEKQTEALFSVKKEKERKKERKESQSSYETTREANEKKK